VQLIKNDAESYESRLAAIQKGELEAPNHQEEMKTSEIAILPAYKE
jgi:endonuclease IV